MRTAREWAGDFPFILIIAVAAWGFWHVSLEVRTHPVTYYTRGAVTASGERFDPQAPACAVRDPRLLGHWIRFYYHGREIWCRANDLMPRGSKAEYDLTPWAFSRLAPLSKGRIEARAIDEGTQ